jgi:O-antigen ligase
VQPTATGTTEISTTVRVGPLTQNMVAKAVAIIVFTTLALGLILPKLAGAGFLLISLIAITWLSLTRQWTLAGLSPLERLMLAAVAGYVAVWLLGWLVNGIDAAGFEGVGRVLRQLLVIPLLLLIMRLDGLEQAWWRGLTAGALLAGFFAWWYFLSGQVSEFEQRVGGSTNPIYFGGIVLAMGLMLLPRIQDASIPTAGRLLAVAALLMAISASALSGSRGAWLALPPLLLLYWVTLGARQPLQWRLGIPAALLALALIVLLSPLAPMSDRAKAGLADVTALIQGESAEGTLGRRAHMWRIAAEIVRDHPLTGAGPDEFRQRLVQAVADERVDEGYLAYRHPHSQYLSALTHAGPTGLLALLILLGLTFRRHIKLWKTGLEQTRYLGWTGLVAIIMLATMALTESIFERNTGIIWFSLFTALSIGLVHARRRHELGQSGRRRHHSLSVIVICKNEADRIDRCLGSVAGWADEIIVLDSDSSDDTVAIAKRYTDRVEVTDWPGFGPQKQRALDKASCDWVLSLDADEWLSPELRAEIELVLARPTPSHQAYCLPWLTHAFGHDLRYGHWSRAPLRLFMRTQGRFTQVPVHEKVVMIPEARIGQLEAPLHHQVYRDRDHARQKLDHYAELGAIKRFESGRRVHVPFSPQLRAFLNFIDNYFFRAAFLNGRGGWILSRLTAWYTLRKYQRLKELGKRDASS